MVVVAMDGYGAVWRGWLREDGGGDDLGLAHHALEKLQQ
jgi:hypothetical protein